MLSYRYSTTKEESLPTPEPTESSEDTTEKDSYVLTLSQKPPTEDCPEQFEECSQV